MLAHEIFHLKAFGFQSIHLDYKWEDYQNTSRSYYLLSVFESQKISEE